MKRLRDLWRREPAMCCGAVDLAMGAAAIVAVGVLHAPWGLMTMLAAWAHGVLTWLTRKSVTPWIDYRKPDEIP